MLSPPLKGPRTFPSAVSWLPLQKHSRSSPLRLPPPFPVFGQEEALTRSENPELPICLGGWSAS